ncbi:hypothetical protein [Solidesulfovibrio sp.]
MNLPKSLENEFNRFGLGHLISAHIRGIDTHEAYGELKQVEDNSFFIYPQQLVRKEETSLENTKLLFIDTISTFYNKHNNERACEIISTCVGELIMNFWAHATDDTDTIVTAKGTKNSFTIVIADNGQGIISTLLPFSSANNKRLILHKCIERGISSKKQSYHMGYGLYYISELAKANKGTLDIWSEGYHLHANKSSTSTTKTGYWKGTITELNLNLLKPRGLTKIDQYKRFKPTIKINFGELHAENN